jgi:hypothetical protein
MRRCKTTVLVLGASRAFALAAPAEVPWDRVGMPVP